MKSTAVHVVLAAGIAASWATEARADPSFDWTSYLKQDLVTVSGDKYMYHEIQVCKMTMPPAEPRAIQFDWSAEAPHGVLSRDQFVSLNASIGTAFLITFAQGLGVAMDKFEEAMDCEPASTAIGEVDVKIRVVYAQGGVQFSITDTSSGKVERNTLTWSQVFQ
jgi:hypothetical protein